MAGCPNFPKASRVDDEPREQIPYILSDEVILFQEPISSQ